MGVISVSPSVLLRLLRDGCLGNARTEPEAGQQAVESGEIGLGAGDDDVGIGTVATKRTVVALTRGRLEPWLRPERRCRRSRRARRTRPAVPDTEMTSSMAWKAASMGPVATDAATVLGPVRAVEANGCRGHARTAPGHLEIDKTEDLLGTRRSPAVTRRLQIGIGDGLLAVGQILEVPEGLVAFLVVELVSPSSPVGRERRAGRCACRGSSLLLGTPTVSGVMIS